jgi:hypothetical protein
MASDLGERRIAGGRREVVQDQRADDAVGDGVLDGELVGEPIAPVDVLGAGLAAGASEDLMVPSTPMTVADGRASISSPDMLPRER